MASAVITVKNMACTVYIGFYNIFNLFLGSSRLLGLFISSPIELGVRLRTSRAASRLEFLKGLKLLFCIIC